MRSTKPIPLMLVIGAVTLGACGYWLGNATSTASSTGINQASESRMQMSGFHISRVTVQQINDLLRLYGIPVVLSTTVRMAHEPESRPAACFVDERDALIISLSVGG